MLTIYEKMIETQDDTVKYILSVQEILIYIHITLYTNINLQTCIK